MGASDSKEHVYLLCCHFNPLGLQNRTQLAINFLKQFSHQYFKKLRVIMVECAIGDAKYELLPDDFGKRVKVLQVRGNSLMWLKENLLNIGLAKIPKDIKWVAWSDADINFIIEPDAYFCQTIIKTLKVYPVAQLFEYANDLGPDGQVIGEFESFGSFVAKKKEINNKNYKNSYPHPGYCWVARVAVLENGFFEKNIIGNGDQHMAFAFIGKSQQSFPTAPLKCIEYDLSLWEKYVMKQTNGKMGFVPQKISHNWHGNKSDRGYVERWQIIIQLDFNSNTDLLYNKHRVLEFSDAGRRFQESFLKYFQNRKEDNVLDVKQLNYPKVNKQENQQVPQIKKAENNNNNNDNNNNNSNNNNNYNNNNNNNNNDNDNNDNNINNDHQHHHHPNDQNNHHHHHHPNDQNDHHHHHPNDQNDNHHHHHPDDQNNDHHHHNPNDQNDDHHHHPNDQNDNHHHHHPDDQNNDHHHHQSNDQNDNYNFIY